MTYEEFQKAYDFDCGPDCQHCRNTMTFVDSLGGHPLSCTIWKDAVRDCDRFTSVDRLPMATWENVVVEDIVRLMAAPPKGVGWVPSVPVEEADVIASDTDRPPSPNGRRCYFCSEPAEHIIHVDMPACDACKRRAVGRRSK